MGENIPGRNFLGGNSGGNSPGRSLIGKNFQGGSFPDTNQDFTFECNFLEQLNQV